MSDPASDSSFSFPDPSTLPPIELYIRSASRSHADQSLSLECRSSIHSTDPFSLIASASPSIPCSEFGFTFSSDGSLLSVIQSSSVLVYSTSPLSLIAAIPRAGVNFTSFSPLGSHLLTFERKSLDGSENLLVWSVNSAPVVVYRCHHKGEFPSDCWPIQWSNKEERIIHRRSDSIAVFSSLSAAPLREFPIRCSIASLSPVGSLMVCITTGQPPVQALLFDLAKESTSPASAVLQRSIMQCDDLALRWSPTGSGVLIQSSTASDQSGKSYYGESAVHLLLADGSYHGSISFEANPGPVQDFAWSPNGKEFLIIQGFQPAKMILYQIQSGTIGYKAIREFGTAPRNTIRFSPHGRFLVLGGFGNLAGEMDFWDCNKFKQLGTAQDRNGAKSYEWTPDGRHFITAALRPWRRVDNQFKVYTYFGQLELTRSYEELYQVTAKPAAAGVFPNRPQSPRCKEMRKQAREEGQKTVNQPKVGAYVPPHLRKAGGNAVNTVAQTIQLQKQNTGPKKLENKSKTANNQSSTKTEVKPMSEAKKADKPVKEEKSIDQSSEEKDPAHMNEEERAKRVKALKKKMKQIEELKAKAASGQALLPEQMEKISGEETIKMQIEEIEKLQIK